MTGHDLTLSHQLGSGDSSKSTQLRPLKEKRHRLDTLTAQEASSDPSLEASNHDFVEEKYHPDTHNAADLENLGLEEAIRLATNRTERSSQILNPSVLGPPKDKGYAWVVCATTLLLFMATWGANSCYGVFLDYWLQNGTYPGASSTDYALVGSIALGLAMMLAPLAQMTAAVIGMRPTLVLGLGFQTSGYILASFSTQLWQLYLTQGVMVGSGFAFIFNPSIVILPDWFDKKRAISFGIIASSSGIGGVIFSLMTQKIISRTGGAPWALRTIGIVTTFMNVVGIALIKERVPTKRLKTTREIKVRLNILFNREVLKIPQLYVISISFSLIVSCYIIAMFSLSSYATTMGMSAAQGSQVTAAYNGCQTIGRVLFGYAGDRAGRVNLSVFLAFIMLVLVLAMWINSTTAASIFAYAVLSGLTFGSSESLNQPILADSIPTDLFPAGWSFQSVIQGCFALFCEVAALKLRDVNISKPFIRAQVFSGCFAAGGLLLIMLFREWRIRRELARKLEETQKEMVARGHTGQAADLEQEYQTLLGQSPKFYILRMLYPMKV
ncbi:hypothetical protein KL909_004932 [Ogataea angusta]|nr:hypothetical protein KL909_004932 [Ogataea angusta]